MEMPCEMRREFLPHVELKGWGGASKTEVLDAAVRGNVLVDDELRIREVYRNMSDVELSAIAMAALIKLKAQTRRINAMIKHPEHKKPTKKECGCEIPS